MLTNISGWLALATLAAVLASHPLRNKNYGPGLITFLFGLGLMAAGVYFLSNMFDFYQRGEVEMLVRGGPILQITKNPVKAYFFLTLHGLISACCLYAGSWFFNILFARLSSRRT